MKRLFVKLSVALAVVACLWWWHFEYGRPLRALTQHEDSDLNWLANAVNDLEHPTVDNANIRRIECENWERDVARWKSLGAPRNKIRRFIAGCAKN